MNTDGIVYRLSEVGRADMANLQETIAEAWIDMHHPGTIAHYLATSAGLDVANYPRGVNEAVKVTFAETVPDGALVAVTGVLRAMAPEDWNNVWNNVLLPRVKKRFGDRALIPVESHP